jgi:hypothetical protein
LLASQSMTESQQTSPSRAPAAGERRLDPALAAALSLQALAAAALVLGAVLPVVDGAVPGFGSGPLLFVLAVLPLALAAVFTLRRRHSALAGLLMGVAALAPGRLLLDLQLLTDSSSAARPELYLPKALAYPGIGTGLWLLLAGHVLTAASGLAAVRFARAQAESAGGAEPQRRRWLPLAAVASIVASVGLLMAPMSSDDLYLVARGAFEGSLTVLGGCLLLVCALLLGVVLALGSPVEGVARGTLVGLGAGVLAVVLPELGSGWFVPVLHVSPGPVAAVVGVAALVYVGFVRAGEAEAETDVVPPTETKVPGLFWWQLTTGALGVLTAAAAFAGGLLVQVTAAGGLPVPGSPARPLLLVSGGFLGLLGLLAVLPPTSRLVRPVLSSAWAGVLLSGAAVLGTALTATRLAAVYSAGPGVIFTCLAMFGAALTAGCSVITGVVERDTDDVAEAVPDAGADDASASLLTPLAAAAVLAVGAFGLPTFTAPSYVAPGLWSNFETTSWGIVAALATVLGAAALALWSRPWPAAALLTGAAAVVALRAAEWPAVGGSVDGSSAGIGFWLSLACVLALLISAVLAAAGGRQPSRKA